jgi:prophage regulatory protein
MATQTTPAPALLRRNRVEARTGLSRSRLYELIAKGEFPAPVALGPKSVAWVSSEVTDWIEARIAAPRRGSAPAADPRRGKRTARKSTATASA